MDGRVSAIQGASDEHAKRTIWETKPRELREFPVEISIEHRAARCLTPPIRHFASFFFVRFDGEMGAGGGGMGGGPHFAFSCFPRSAALAKVDFTPHRVEIGVFRFLYTSDVPFLGPKWV